jgi:hypothetical protein
MNDPHVASLAYRVLETASAAFADASEVTFQTPEFDGRLADGVLTLTPRIHFSDEAEARAISEAFVRTWEIAAGYEYGSPDFSLRFEGAEIVDRAPSPGHADIQLSEHLSISEQVQVKVIRHTYPPPPISFAVTPEVEVIWERFCRYVAGNEPLLSMAYFCLTLLERGDRRAAARQLAIDYEILNRLGELTSTRGDRQTARKLTATTHPLTPEEAHWVEATIKAIGKHLATRVPDSKPLSLADLPKL